MRRLRKLTWSFIPTGLACQRQFVSSRRDSSIMDRARQKKTRLGTSIGRPFAVGSMSLGHWYFRQASFNGSGRGRSLLLLRHVYSTAHLLLDRKPWGTFSIWKRSLQDIHPVDLETPDTDALYAFLLLFDSRHNRHVALKVVKVCARNVHSCISRAKTLACLYQAHNWPLFTFNLLLCWTAHSRNTLVNLHPVFNTIRITIPTWKNSPLNIIPRQHSMKSNYFKK